MLNKDTLKQWKQDLRDCTADESFPKFNMNHEIIHHPTRKYEGDAGLILAFRYADRPDLEDFMRPRTSHSVISEFTGIPIQHAYLLLNPPTDLDIEYDEITPEQFIAVLDAYVQTNMVTWAGHVSKELQEMARDAANG